MPVVCFPPFSFQPGFVLFVCVTSWRSVLLKSMISAYLLSRFSFLVLYMDFFNLLLTLLQFFSYDSLLKLFHFLHSCLLLIISYIIHDFFVFLLTFWTQTLAVSHTDLWILLHYNSTFPLARSIVEFFFCLWAYTFSKSHFGFPFWNLMIFFNPLAKRNLWS